MHGIRALAVTALTGLAIVSASQPPSVTIAAGTLTGGICEKSPEAVYYKAVPYALPPTGDRRFRPPQPYNQTYPGNQLNASQSAPFCVQFGSSPTFLETGASSEDCLYLNIWAPASATNTSALPVRFWVYGGSNVGGGVGDPTYDGCNVPQTNAIMVSVNYRLGPLGFLAVKHTDIKGNQAIQDITLALEWVQQNIAAFGGDPKKVMAHGQSAGAVNLYTIATQPQAPFLMSSAIFESGGGREVQLRAPTEQLGGAYAKALNCSDDASCLRNAMVKNLQDAFNGLSLVNIPYADLAMGNITSPTFYPYVDGDTIPHQPKKGVRVPSIFGFNKNEGNIFTVGQFNTIQPNPAIAYNQSIYTSVLVENFGPATAKLIEDRFPISAYNSTPFPAFAAMSDTLTMDLYQCSAYRGLKRAVANNIPVWTYRFSHDPTCPWYPAIPADGVQLLGATHTSEIPFILGTTDNMPQPDGNCTFTADEKAISDFMNNAWTNMAALQKPTTNDTAWPQFTDVQQSMGIDIVNASNPAQIDYSVCEFWDYLDELLLRENSCQHDEDS